MSALVWIKNTGRRTIAATTTNLLPRRAGLGINGHGIMGFAVDKTERAGVSLGLGALKGYYRERYFIRGISADAWIGGVATALSGLLCAYTGGSSALAPHVERLGDAALGAYLNTVGVAWGTQRAGRTVKTFQGGRELPRLSTPSGVIGEEAIGEIPRARPGAYLSDDEFAHYSGPR